MVSDEQERKLLTIATIVNGKFKFDPTIIRNARFILNVIDDSTDTNIDYDYDTPDGLFIVLTTLSKNLNHNLFNIENDSGDGYVLIVIYAKMLVIHTYTCDGDFVYEKRLKMSDFVTACIKDDISN